MFRGSIVWVDCGWPNVCILRRGSVYEEAYYGKSRAASPPGGRVTRSAMLVKPPTPFVRHAIFARNNEYVAPFRVNGRRGHFSLT